MSQHNPPAGKTNAEPIASPAHTSLSWSLRWRLSVLWILEWGITGALLTYLPVYFREHGLTESRASQLMAIGAIGLWVAPFVVGQLCDRWMASDRYLALAHLLGGGILLLIPPAVERFSAGNLNFGWLLLLFGMYASIYFPTIPLASSLTFLHLPDPNRQFGGVRIFGTVGWVIAGLVLSLWLGRTEAYDWIAWNVPRSVDFLDAVGHAFRRLPQPHSGDSFRIAGILSFLLAGFSWLLPHTPPTGSFSGGVAPLETFRMFRDRTFTLLIVTSFLLALAIPIYSFAVPTLIEQALIRHQLTGHWVPAVMTVGQISEFPALLLLHAFLRRFGMKATFALGIVAWIVRYAIFAATEPFWLVLFGISLHGICHVFLVIVIQLYVDQSCRADLRASAQNMFAFITMGIAMPVGFLLAGWLGSWCNILGERGEANFLTFFGVPSLFLLVLLGYFLYALKLTPPTRQSTLPASSHAG